MSTAPRLIYIGSYTTGTDGANGITCWRQDPQTGALTPALPPTRAADPSFLAWHPAGAHLYAVSESAGQVLSFAVQPDGTLTPLGAEPTLGVDPCHLSVDPAGRAAVVANYGDGKVSVHRIAADGSLGRPHHLAQHAGTGPDPQRQEGPHAHMAVFSPTDERLYVTDLGTDRIESYTLDDHGRLTPGPASPVGAGVGPRHVAFHPSLRAGFPAGLPAVGHAYVTGELDSSLVVCALRGDTLQPVFRLPATVTPPGPGDEPNFPSHVECAPDGRFVYVANRGADCLSVFAVEGETLRPVADVPTGRWPRHFALVGDFVYVANQYAGTVTVLRRDPVTGVPTSTGQEVSVPHASCVLAQL